MPTIEVGETIWILETLSSIVVLVIVIPAIYVFNKQYRLWFSHALHTQSQESIPPLAPHSIGAAK